MSGWRPAPCWTLLRSCPPPARVCRCLPRRIRLCPPFAVTQRREVGRAGPRGPWSPCPRAAARRARRSGRRIGRACSARPRSFVGDSPGLASTLMPICTTQNEWMTSLLVTWKTTGRSTGRYSWSDSTLPCLRVAEGPHPLLAGHVDHERRSVARRRWLTAVHLGQAPDQQEHAEHAGHAAPRVTGPLVRIAGPSSVGCCRGGYATAAGCRARSPRPARRPGRLRARRPSSSSRRRASSAMPGRPSAAPARKRKAISSTVSTEPEHEDLAGLEAGAARRARSAER